MATIQRPPALPRRRAKVPAVSDTMNRGFSIQQTILANSQYATKHPDYIEREGDWQRIRDCIKGESVIKLRAEKYLPRPSGMQGEYAASYDGYIERAHFPQICAYALQGALGVVITKLPEFKVPPQLKYILETATKDGISIQQLFTDTIVEILQTGKCPLVVDVLPLQNQFRFVRYTAEGFLNWKEQSVLSERSLVLGVLQEEMPCSDDIFMHDTVSVYRALYIDEHGYYATKVYGPQGEIVDMFSAPSFMGKRIATLPLFLAGSINNGHDQQPVPLLSVANCSIQIYRKEADLANSEFLSCNPTLVVTGSSNDSNLPNVVGSSVMIVIPDPAARVFYTTTDTAALAHVSKHIEALYDEAIRHGVAILDARKGVEAAEALRIRQATQSATIYSVYLSALNAVKAGLQLMCEWGGYNKDEVIIDAPSALTYGIPDATVLREIITGFGGNVIPLTVIHRYLVGSGLLDQTVSFEDYSKELASQRIWNKPPEEPKAVGEDDKSKTPEDDKTKSEESKGSDSAPEA